MLDNYISAIIETQIIGIVRVTLTLPLEHSLDRLKTHMQQRHIPISAFKVYLTLFSLIEFPWSEELGTLYGAIGRILAKLDQMYPKIILQMAYDDTNSHILPTKTTISFKITQ